MRKAFARIGIIVFAVLFLFTGCVEKEKKETEETKTSTLIVKDFNGFDLEKINQYDMNMVFSPEEHTIKGTQKVDYINNENIPLSEVYFHLYPNNFKKEETAPFLPDDFKRAYPDGFEPGDIDIKKVSINGNPSKYALEKEETIMKVMLPNELKPSEKVSIEMEYSIKIPPAQERFGYADNTFNLGNWYPIAAVYDETGWNLDPYYPIGDPFYSDVSNYNVHIETPKDFVVAASGNIMKDEIIDEKRTWDIEAKLMRDFAWVVSDDFEVVQKDVEGTTIKMYFLKHWKSKEDTKEWAIESSEKALKTFNKLYGKYPYGQYSVVQTNFPSGMEYPGIIFVDKESYTDEYGDYLEILIAHETGHQWWYGVVGNDEIDEAWLDESLTTYSEVVYYIDNFGKDVGKEYHQDVNEGEYNESKKSIDNETILRPLSKFKNWTDYGPLVYNKGAMFVNSIYEKYGEEKFYQIMQKYYQTYRFKNATTKDFKKVCEDVTGEDLDELFNQWLLAK